jgi:hypothetical protein
VERDPDRRQALCRQAALARKAALAGTNDAAARAAIEERHTRVLTALGTIASALASHPGVAPWPTPDVPAAEDR